MTGPQVARVVALGDSALTAELESGLDVRINRAAVAVGERVRAAAMAGVRDVVVTMDAVTAYVDPLIVDWRALESLMRAPLEEKTVAGPEPEPVVVPVTYGGEEGPDLDEVARRCGCTPDEVVAWHSAATYRVFMLGFLPGFAYLGPLDPRLRLPRRDVPRARVGAGSVAIAGGQTAIYPMESPGGWWIIGHTAWRPFDLHREPACLLDVGAAVRFAAA